MQPPYYSMDLANFVIIRSNKEYRHPISTLKLQNILYFVTAKYFHDHGEMLLNEPFFKMQYGPNLAKVTSSFVSYQINHAKIQNPYKYLTDETCLDIGRMNLVFANVEDIYAAMLKNERLVETVDFILEKLIDYDGLDLTLLISKANAYKLYQKEILQGQELIYTKHELFCAIDALDEAMAGEKGDS